MEQVTEFLESTQREGMDDLITFLKEKTDFFTAPASVRNHGAFPGGLLKHSLNVLACADKINGCYDTPYADSSITIVSLLHDVCKVNCYIAVDEPPTSPQLKYLTSLMAKVGLKVPVKLNKAYAGDLIDFMLNSYKNDGVILPYVFNYKYKDSLPLGHGEKSLYIISRFIKLSVEEALAIRWHMGAFDLNQQSPYQRYAFSDAVKMSKLVTILQLADLEAAQLVEM